MADSLQPAEATAPLPRVESLTLELTRPGDDRPRSYTMRNLPGMVRCICHHGSFDVPALVTRAVGARRTELVLIEQCGGCGALFRCRLTIAYAPGG